MYLAWFLKLVTEKTTIKNPDNNNPKLNNGATSLLTECPISLKASVPQLNQGDNTIDNAMKAIAIKGAINPTSA